MAPGTGPQSAAETFVFQGALKEPEPGWRWVREENATWRFCADGLEMATKPGGLWGRVFSELPAPPLLLRSLDGANAFEVTVTMPSTPGGRGEQAGLFWHIDDDNYAKLVVEWSRDGTAKLVFAQEDNNEPSVCGEADLDGDAAYEPIRLRIEVSPDGSQLTGVMNGAYYMRLVGRCSTSCAGWNSRTAQIGLSAHGGTAEGVTAGRVAKFADFKAISIRPDRVQWGGLAAADVASVAVPMDAPATQQLSLSPDMLTGGYPNSGGSGWTLSENLTEAQRSQIQAMLGANGLPALGEEDLQPAAPPPSTGEAPPPSTGLSGWTLSPTLTQAERQEISTLLGANGLPTLSEQDLRPAQEGLANGGPTQNGTANGRSRSRSQSPSR